MSLQLKQGIEPMNAVAHTSSTRHPAQTRLESQLRAWMMAGLDGDRESYQKLLRAAAPLLIEFFHDHTGWNQRATDVLVRQTLVAVDQRRASFSRTRDVSPWLYAIASHFLSERQRLTPQPVVSLPSKIPMAARGPVTAPAALAPHRTLQSIWHDLGFVTARWWRTKAMRRSMCG